MSSEKLKVAMTSVVAAVFLTVIKIIVGLATGSLGILSEAAHSTLDLGAALVTFFAVRISDKPADPEHNYGHGKVESFSALIETLLLLGTCVWIIYEAVGRIFLGKMVEIGPGESFWGIGIMALSIAINISRSEALKKAAKKYGSQALEADALHFGSDVWSSCVVIGGLLCVTLADYFKAPALQYGDPIAALGVSALVIAVSVKLGKRTIDVLLDTAPKGMLNDVILIVNNVKGVLEASNVRIRPSGPNYFIDLNVGIGRNESHRVVHSIVHEIRERLMEKIPNSDIVISTFPVDVQGTGGKEMFHTVKKIVDRFPVCTNIHNIHIYEVGGRNYIAIHIEVKEKLSLEESHELSHAIGDLIQSSVENVEDVSVNFEYVEQNHIRAVDITGESGELIERIKSLIDIGCDNGGCHDVKVYRQDDKLTIFLHCELNKSYTTEKTEQVTKSVTEKIRSSIGNVDRIHIHFEPMDK